MTKFFWNWSSFYRCRSIQLTIYRLVTTASEGASQEEVNRLLRCVTLQNLKDDIKSYVRDRDLDTHVKILSLARRREATLLENSPTPSTEVFPVGTKVKSNRGFYSCGRNNHYASSCRLPSRNRSSNFRELEYRDNYHYHHVFNEIISQHLSLIFFHFLLIICIFFRFCQHNIWSTHRGWLPAFMDKLFTRCLTQNKEVSNSISLNYTFKKMPQGSVLGPLLLLISDLPNFCAFKIVESSNSEWSEVNMMDTKIRFID